jgi:MFS family permease
MFDILADRTYRHLFLAQVVALLGTGLATVALGLLAFDLAGEGAALVLGTIFTIKMVAYVGIAPIVGAFADRLPRRAFLVTLDLVRAGVALALPFVTEIWQVYVLIFLLQSASAAFTPTFQATIPDVLPDEARYTRALSLSRLAYDLENIVSPTLAALLLAVMSYNSLFLGTVVGFVASALLVISVLLPSPSPSKPRGIYDRTTRGIRIYLATPRLRGLLALNLAAAAAGAMVLVNTVVLRHAWAVGKRAGLGDVRLWRGLDDGRAGSSTLAGCAARSPRDVRRCGADGDNIAGARGNSPDRWSWLGCPSGGMGAGGAWIFRRPHPVWPIAAPIRPCGRSHGVVCSAVRAVARLLAGDLSAGGLAADSLWYCSRSGRAGASCGWRDVRRPETLAVRRSFGT